METRVEYGRGQVNSLDNVIIADNLPYEAHLLDLSTEEFAALFA